MAKEKKSAAPSTLLPEVSFNKKYVKKQKMLDRREMRELKRENPQEAARLEKAKLKKERAEKRAAEAAAAAKKAGKKVVKQAASKLSKKKDRRPKTVIANEATGKETLVKKKARELVKQRRQEAKLKSKMTEKAKKAKGAARQNKDGDDSGEQQQQQPEPIDLDQLLLTRTIYGGSAGDDFDGSAAAAAAAAASSSFVRRDPSLYPPEVAFYEDYAEKKQAEAVDEDVVLRNANEYFKKVGKRERQLNIAAAAYLKKMKEVNRRGGDKDGFTYVLPRNVKETVQMMREDERRAKGGAIHPGEEDLILDEDTKLTSTFGGDMDDALADKPVRRRRKNPRFYTDFYQHQVSKKWVKNAESFLTRGRAHKSLFEAKKRQRNIRKL